MNFSAQSLLVNKLRTSLSLLGVTIGIFAIMSAFSAVDSLEDTVKGMFSSMGDNLLFIHKMPWGIEEGEEEYAFWEYIKRPEPSIDDLEKLMSRLTKAENGAFRCDVMREVRYFNNVISGAPVLICSKGMEQVYPFEIEEGRFFTGSEEASGKAVCLVGAKIVDDLFNGGDPIGRTIKIGGKKAEIIGSLVREGESFLGGSIDEVLMIPTGFGRSIADLTRTENMLLITTKPGVSNVELIDEINGKMRAIRKLPPKRKKDFSVDELSVITNFFDGIFGFFKTVALIIGLFSILVGGFGIANIMFVSVKERTNIIGIQKALGAKQAFILLQFLVESIFLCFIGGLIAILLIMGLFWGLNAALNSDFYLSWNNALLCVSMSVGIGVIAGFVPAWKASRMDPVEAIRAS
ncbi:MAG: ABC transporter permease [Flavobacteriales bacterium]|nr:ABC transporter permease [Flavobacteriales bacterium]